MGRPAQLEVRTRRVLQDLDRLADAPLGYATEAHLRKVYAALDAAVKDTKERLEARQAVKKPEAPFRLEDPE